MDSEDTSTSLELFETSNTQEVPTPPPRVVTSGPDGQPCSNERPASSTKKAARLPRRWMPTMTPRTRSAPTMSMALMWEMKDRAAGELMLADLEAMLQAATRFCPGLPGWSVSWQLSRDPKAGYRVGLVLWMSPDPEPPH